MGHIRLGRLPRTYRWKQVIALLEDQDSTFQELAGSTLHAVETGLRNAGKDEGLVTTFWLLTQLTDSATKGDFTQNLNRIGLNIPCDPSLFDITSAFSNYIDSHVTIARRRSDISQLASSAAIECLTNLCASESASLFDSSADDVQKSFKKLGTRANFSKLGHEFFSRFTYRYATYLISRELSNHVGVDGRFKVIDNHKNFNNALNLHCRQATRIVDDFAGGWYSKNVYQEKLTIDNAAKFIHVALKKLRSEFKRGGDIGKDELPDTVQ